jgi:hypothetical protein
LSASAAPPTLSKGPFAKRVYVALRGDALACLSGVRSLVIDGELVACDAAGRPDFYRLHFHRHGRGLCVRAFDLLHPNRRDLRALLATHGSRS